MKPGRTPWTVKLTRAQLRHVHDRIDSAEKLKAADIHRGLGLQSRISVRRFRENVAARRRARVNRSDTETRPRLDRFEMAAELLNDAYWKIVNGSVPGYALGETIGAMVEPVREVRRLQQRVTLRNDLRGVPRRFGVRAAQYIVKIGVGVAV